MKAEENSDTKCTLHELYIFLILTESVVHEGTVINKNNIVMAVSA